MIRTILFLLLSGVTTLAQTITGAAITARGSEIELYCSGLNTNGTYSLNWDTNNWYSSTNSIRLSVVSRGYNDDGSTNATPFRVFGTRQTRIPGVTNSSDIATSTGIKLTIELSKPISSVDYGILLSTESGLYSQGGSNLTSVSSMSVTNSSVQPYEQTVANWSWPGWQYIPSSTFTNYVQAYHTSARKGRPVRAVKGIATDGTNTAVVWAYAPKIQRAWGEAIAVPKYELIFDVSSFPQPAFVTVNFVAFPWRGDTNSVFDTAATGFTMPDWRGAPITNLIDSARTFPITRAIVATNGVNATGVAAWPSYWATNTSPPAFLDFGGALTAIAATNNARHGFNNLTAAEVYVNAGSHTWLNSACTITAGPRMWVRITPNSGVSREDAVIAAQATDTRCTNDRDLFLFDNMTFNTSGALFVQENIWMDRCMILNLTSSSVNQATGAQCLWYITRSVISNLTQGIRSFTTQRLAPALVQGNWIVGNVPSAHFLTMSGNVKTTNGSGQFVVTSGFSGGLLQKDGQILSYNALYKVHLLGDILSVGVDSNTIRGVVIANNLFEQTTNNTASTAYGIGYTSLRNFTNFMVWCNDLLGTKTFYGYDNSDTNTSSYREQWSTYGNIFSNMNVKDDRFAPISNVRTGNWQIVFGNNMIGNALLETTNVGAFGSFIPQFAGVNSWGALTVNATGTNYARFRNRLDHDGSNTLPGGGDYRIFSDSPLFRRNKGPRNGEEGKWILSHDLDGKPRSEDDPPGAYVAGQRLEGSMGFAE